MKGKESKAYSMKVKLTDSEHKYLVEGRIGINDASILQNKIAREVLKR